MEANDNLLYEYAVIRYVPRLDRGEFVNVGLLMMCKRRRWIRAAIHIDTARVEAIDCHTDCRLLRRQLSLFEQSGVPYADSPVEDRFRWLTAAKSAVLQTSPPHPGLAVPQDGESAAETLDRTFDRLMRELVM